MYKKQEIIIQKSRSGSSQRSIARDLGISRKTVNKYLEEYNSLCTTLGPSKAQQRYLSEVPSYPKKERVRSKITDKLIGRVDYYLNLNREHHEGGRHKQVLKNTDIHDHLLDEGFDLSYSSICTYIKKQTLKKSRKEAYIRQSYMPGQDCEFDWGVLKLIIEGKETSLHLAVFTNCYGNYRYARLYHRQDTLAFQESHVAFFDHIQGVPETMIYDNMRVAIARFVGKTVKEPTDALLAMRGHYLFSHRFCNAYRGNEKGHVERSVEVVRRKAFSKKIDYNTLDEAQDHLLKALERLNSTRQQLTGKSGIELLNEEREFLQKLPHPLSCSELVELRVDKYSTVSYKKNRYSMPDHLVGKMITLKCSSDKVEAFYDSKPVAQHYRNYGCMQWIIDIKHYLDTLNKKPGALPNSIALKSNKYLKSLFDSYFQDSIRDFIDLIYYCRNYKIDYSDVTKAVTLLETNHTDVSTDKIIAILGNTEHKIPKIIDINSTTIHSKELLQKASLLFSITPDKTNNHA